MISEDFKIVPLIQEATDFGATSDLDSIDMSNYHKATFIFLYSTCGAAVVHSFNSGASEGTKTTAVACQGALGGAAIGTAVAGSAASCDVLGAWQACAVTLSLVATTKMTVFEVNAAAMTAGEPWLTATIAAATGVCAAVAILEPRYSANRSVTALK